MLNIFVLVSSGFSLVTALPLIYLAVCARRDGRDLRLIHRELAGVMLETKELGEEVRELQREIRRDQREATDGIAETQRTVEQVTEAVGQVTEAVEQVGSAVELVGEAVDDVRLPTSRRLLRRLVGAPERS